MRSLRRQKRSNPRSSRGSGLRRRHLLFEELETRQLLAAGSLVMTGASGNAANGSMPSPGTTPSGSSSTPSAAINGQVSPSVIAAAVVLTPLVLTPSTLSTNVVQNPLVLGSGTVNPVGSTQLQLIIALGEDALTATDVPDATNGAALNSLPAPWAPTLGTMTPLSQTLGGAQTRTESLEQGPLGQFNRLGRGSHGMVPGSSSGNLREAPGTDRIDGPEAEQDSFNVLSAEEPNSLYHEAATDLAIVEMGDLNLDDPVFLVPGGPQTDRPPAPLRPTSW